MKKLLVGAVLLSLAGAVVATRPKFNKPAVVPTIHDEGENPPPLSSSDARNAPLIPKLNINAVSPFSKLKWAARRDYSRVIPPAPKLRRELGDGPYEALPRDPFFTARGASKKPTPQSVDEDRPALDRIDISKRRPSSQLNALLSPRVKLKSKNKGVTPSQEAPEKIESGAYRPLNLGLVNRFDKPLRENDEVEVLQKQLFERDETKQKIDQLRVGPDISQEKHAEIMAHLNSRALGRARNLLAENFISSGPNGTRKISQASLRSMLIKNPEQWSTMNFQTKWSEIEGGNRTSHWDKIIGARIHDGEFEFKYEPTDIDRGIDELIAGKKRQEQELSQILSGSPGTPASPSTPRSPNRALSIAETPHSSPQKKPVSTENQQPSQPSSVRRRLFKQLEPLMVG